MGPGSLRRRGHHPTWAEATHHELAHIAAGTTRDQRAAWHGPRWRGYFRLAAEEVIGERIEMVGNPDLFQFHEIIAAAMVKWAAKGAE